jgi:tetratricopeptide (TPR) repeat protein
MSFGRVSEEHIKIAELSRKIGEILVERGDHEQAMHQFQLGLQYLDGIEHNEVARIYNEIGRVYWHQGKFKEHQDWTEKAFDLAERLLDPDEVARLLYFAGIRYRRQGANRLAEEHWLRSLEISEETGDLAMQGRLYQNLGWLVEP